MTFIPGFHGSSPASPVIEGVAGYRAPQMDSGLRLLGRREWWLWLSALVVTLLATLAFLLSSVPALFTYRDHFYEIGSDQAAWGTTLLLLLFNTWLVYRLWFFRQLRRRAGAESMDRHGGAENADAPSALDPVTGFYTPVRIEQRLAKETAHARRQKTPLSLVALHVEDFAQIVQRFGRPAGDQVLKEFARRLKKATRGSDFGVRLDDDDFLLVLPECGLAAAKLWSDRLGPLEMKCGGQDITLTYSAGWIDYQPGESPAALLERARRVLQLYKAVSKDSPSLTLAAG
jgi:diguanylate cyclase (GGDEF)-like protein